MNKKSLSIASAAAVLFLSGAVGAMAEEAKGGGEVMCEGVNACKGHGACAGANNACAGKNGCKGQGMTKTSAEDCKAKGGKVVESKKH